jgi:hypothetical protein
VARPLRVVDDEAEEVAEDRIADERREERAADEACLVNILKMRWK